MVSVRIRSIMWFAAGIALAITALWATTAWRVDAAPDPGESTVVAVAPERVLDTRNPTDLGLAGPFTSPVSQKLQLTGPIPTANGMKTVVPIGATGVLLNVTATGPTADGFLAIRPGDATGAPTTSSLNFTAGSTTPNSVQVSLPTAGTGAGMIDITYDALGVAGPTTDVLIDVVGYTTSAGIQDLVKDLASKANATDVYTKAQVDAGFVAHGEVVVRHAPLLFPNDGAPPTSIVNFYNISTVNGGNGAAQMALPGPASRAGVAYGLKSVTYCMKFRTDSAFITAVRITGSSAAPAPDVFAIDTTDRTVDGCYTVEVNDKTSTSFGFALEFAGGDGSFSLATVTSTWAPASTIP